MLYTILKTRIVAQNGCEKIEDYLSLNNISEDNETNKNVTIFNVAILKSGFRPWPQWASALTLLMSHIDLYLYNPHQALASNPFSSIDANVNDVNADA